MSGHSKWSTIKHKKGKADAARSRIFTKIIKEITIAARLGGGDSSANTRLRAAISNAKINNLPKDNIENAIKKGTGEMEGVSYEDYSLEGYGPEGVAIMVDALTDNKNRTVAEIRSIFSKNGGSMADKGAVSWMFKLVGEIEILKEKYSEDQVTELALEAGADDVDTSDGEVYVLKFEPTAIDGAISFFESKGVALESAGVNKVADSLVALSGEKAEKVLKILNMLEEHDDTQKVYANFKMLDE